MRRGIPAATTLPVRAAGIVAAVAVAVALGLVAACGSGGSKPSATVAGCDLPRVSDPDLPAKYMVALELYNGHVVTGEARSSAFDALFSGGRVHDQGALLGWFTIHENDADLLIDNRTPGEWDIFRTNLISDIETLGTFSEQAASPERKRLRPWS